MIWTVAKFFAEVAKLGGFLGRKRDGEPGWQAIWDGWEKLQMVPMLIVTPLTFLGGSFYSINMLPPLWQKIALFNPVVYLVSGFRWSFYGVADVNVVISFGMTLLFLILCLVAVRWIFRTGYRLKA